MTHEEFATHVKEFLIEMRETMAAKNPDYSAGTDDAMNDYHSASSATGVTPLQAWAVLTMKHVHAIQRYVKTGSVSSEAIHGRFVDLANYAVLGDALVKDLAAKRDAT
jgi:hypothetical protein